MNHNVWLAEPIDMVFCAGFMYCMLWNVFVIIGAFSVQLIIGGVKKRIFIDLTFLSGGFFALPKSARKIISDIF